MIGMRLGSDTITLRQRTLNGQDAYGNDTWSTTDQPIAGCRVVPRMSTADGVEVGQQVVSGLWVYAPTDSDLTAADAVVWDGNSYEIDGEPGMWRTPGGRIAYQQVALRRVTG